MKVWLTMQSRSRIRANHEQNSSRLKKSQTTEMKHAVYKGPGKLRLD